MFFEQLTKWWDLNADLLYTASGETLYMVFAAGIASFLLGVPLGVVLHITKKNGLIENPRLNRILGMFVNVGRSIPFLVLMVAVIPFTKLVVGTFIGTTAAIVPLTVGAIPFVARLIEGALLDIPDGLVEVAQSMGATPQQIILKVLLPEAMPAIINVMTITLVTLVGYSAMAGTVGGGGLGDVAIRYGFNRYDVTMMIITIVLLVCLVQFIQSVGDAILRKFDHR